MKALWHAPQFLHLIIHLDESISGHIPKKRTPLRPVTVT